MYQRPSRVMEVPAPIAAHPRMMSIQTFRANIMPRGYTGLCNVDCILGFRLVWDRRHRHSLFSYCPMHEEVGNANDILKGIFLAAHTSRELYPYNSKRCYDSECYNEKLYRIHKLLPCQYCGLRFLSVNDREDHMTEYHQYHGQ